MVWRPKKHPSPEDVQRAKAWLQPGRWKLGVLETIGDTQWRGAMHPDADGSGTHPGVEVWTQAEPAVAADEGARELVLREGEKRGWPREELDASVAIESGWNPAAHNKQRFGGLIGFSPSFARKHVGSPERLWRLSIAEQAPLVGLYFDGVGRKWSKPGDTYLALAAPAYLGASDSTIVYARGTKAWEQNPGWRGPDGEITAGSIRAVVLRKMARGKPSLPKGPPAPQAGSPSSEWFSFLLSSYLRDFAAGHRFNGDEFGRAVEAVQSELGALGVDGDLGPLTVARMREKGWLR